MTTLHILHITDIHFGQYRMRGVWPAIRESFYADVKHLAGMAGSIDVIALTGDVANQAAPEQYDDATDFIQELVLNINAATQQWPELACVPGNHDVKRDVINKIEKKVLENGWDEEIEAGVFGQAPDLCRDAIQLSLEHYREWVRSAPCTMVTVENKGHLTGDFSATLEKDGLRIGFLGLNSTYRHISDWPTENSLTVSPGQVHAAAGGDLPRWGSNLDFGFILSHHPLSWLENKESFIDTLLYEGSPLKVHLCGHLHEPKYTSAYPGSTQEYLTIQGASLFGSETYPSGERRLHGYSLVRLELNDETAEIRIYPRSAHETDGGAWRFAKSQEFGMKRSSELTNPLIKVELAKQAKKTVDTVTDGSPTDSIVPPSRPTQPRDRRTEAVDQLRIAVSSGSATLVLGELFQEEGKRTQLADFKKTCIAVAGFDLQANLSAPIEELFPIALSIDPTFTRQALAIYQQSLTDYGVQTLNLLLKLPWLRVFCITGIDLEFLSSLGDIEPAKRYAIHRAQLEPFVLPGSHTQALVQYHDTLDPELMHGRGPAKEYLQQRSSDWMGFVKQTLIRTPTVILADDVNETAIRRVIDMVRASRDRRNAPSATLVCPEIDARTERLLQMHNILWLPSDARTVLTNILLPGDMKVAEGQQRLGRFISEQRRGLELNVSHLRASAGEGSREYLRGSEPTWGDIINGFAADLSFTDEVEQVIRTSRISDPKKAILIADTAGAGRTTVLMQLALRFEAGGYQVGWIESRTNQQVGRVTRLVDEVVENKFDIVFVDDVDGYGPLAVELIAALRHTPGVKASIVLGCRSVRTFILEDVPDLMTVRDRKLSDSDVQALVALLRQHNVVPDRRKSDLELRDLLLTDSQGQLLVGMIQATTGQLFADRIASECGSLSGSAMLLYSTICLISSLGESLTVDQALNAVSAEVDATQAWADFEALERSKLITGRDSKVFYESRHRVIAERVVEYISAHGMLARTIKRALSAFASAAGVGRDFSRPERRILTRLLGHTYLIDKSLTEEEIRSIYEGVESKLIDDFHYWLQRGSFELERGDLELSRRALMSARTIAGGESDVKVLTTYSRLRLQLATQEKSPDSLVFGVEAIKDLHRVIEIHGVDSPHTFVILCTDGVPWLLQADIARSEKVALAMATRRYLTWQPALRLETHNSRFAEVRRGRVVDIEHLLADLGVDVEQL